MCHRFSAGIVTIGILLLVAASSAFGQAGRSEIYNLTNRVNFGDPAGNRNSANFMVPIVAGEPRTVQIGMRLTF